MSRSKKINLGFQVVDVRTGAIRSEVFDRRAPARAIAVKITREEPSSFVGVRTLEDYVAADATKEEIAARRAAARNLPPGSVR
jgi:hypothetical protein